VALWRRSFRAERERVVRGGSGVYCHRAVGGTRDDYCGLETSKDIEYRGAILVELGRELVGHRVTRPPGGARGANAVARTSKSTAYFWES